VVLKAAGIPEWRKIFEAEDSDFGAIEILEFLESANFEAILRRARKSADSNVLTVSFGPTECSARHSQRFFKQRQASCLR
jgi:hypothetical protein